MPSISQVPNEILVNIFNHLDVPSLLRCRAVCTYFRAVVLNTISLQYQIALTLFGYENIPNTPGISITIAERGDQLRKYISSRRSLKWTESHAFTGAGDQWDSFERGVVVTTNFLQEWISFLDLPSILRGTPERKWRFDNIGPRTLDYTVNMDQDLLILIEDWDSSTPRDDDSFYPLKFHLRTMSGCNPHPLAHHKVLTISVNVTTVISCNTRALGQMFCALVAGHTHTGARTDLFLINWHSGLQLGHLSLNAPAALNDFSLLDLDHILIAQTIHEDLDPASSIQYYELSHTGGPDSMLHIASFRFPRLQSLVGRASLSIWHTRPSVGPINGRLRESVRDQRSFQDVLDQRAIVIYWEVTGPLIMRHDYTIFFPRRALSNVARHYHPGSQPITMEWDAWGVDNTRLTELTANCGVDVDGCRVLTTDPSWSREPHLTTGQYLTIINFPTLRTGHTFDELEGDAKVSTYELPSSIPTVITDDSIFHDSSVTTRLPCRCVTLLDHDVSEHLGSVFLCDDEHVVWLSAPEDQEDTQVDILTLNPGLWQ